MTLQVLNDQWEIRDFPDNGIYTNTTGAVPNLAIFFYQKLHEIESRGQMCVPDTRLDEQSLFTQKMHENE